MSILTCISPLSLPVLLSLWQKNSKYVRCLCLFLKIPYGSLQIIEGKAQDFQNGLLVITKALLSIFPPCTLCLDVHTGVSSFCLISMCSLFESEIGAP